jgi:hypothetical protein
MADLKSAGRLRHLIEAVLWSGCVVLILAITSSALRPAMRPPQRGSAAKQWVDLRPRPMAPR